MTKEEILARIDESMDELRELSEESDRRARTDDDRQGWRVNYAYQRGGIAALRGARDLIALGLP